MESPVDDLGNKEHRAQSEFYGTQNLQASRQQNLLTTGSFLLTGEFPETSD